ncbi:intradiol ring-cleavage dioxygenase [Burkholderia sp. BCC1977]|uniref:intradiol ring-cleavage dioxygenase n=1 Tax=Burkholderia sp. BCC1977 TaxID=2817440 RepID=UPI002ABD29BE|nr:intradiol ring-cleavage dioxygenase [Burkholderia sp. BCC1977]
MTSSRHLSRRRFVTSTLALGTCTALRFPTLGQAAQIAPAGVCTLSPEQEIGPYYLDENLLRGDISEGKAGVPLLLELTILDARHCVPLANAIVDIWQCDALGVYSGFTKASEMQGPPPGPPPGARDRMHGAPPFGAPAGAQRADLDAVPNGPPPAPPTDQLTFLRGTMRTDGSGKVAFRSIVPGVYPGRTNHVHFKVREPATSNRAAHVSHVGQVFFPEALMVDLMTMAPYVEHRIARTTLSDDAVYARQHGDATIAHVTALDGSHYSRGLRARIVATVAPEMTQPDSYRSTG